MADVEVRIIGRDEASGAIKNVQNALGGLQSETGKASGAMGMLGQAASVAGGFIIAQLGTAAVSAVSNLTKEMVNLAREQDKVMTQSKNLLNNIGLKEYAAGIDQIIAKHEEMTGLDDVAIAKSYSTIVAATKDHTKALDILNLSSDLAVAKQLDLEQATKMVMMAMDGNTGMFSRYGIFFDDLAMKSMDASEKFAYIQKELNTTFGGAAEAYRNSAAGQMANFENQLANVKKLFGASIIETLGPALDQVGTKLASLLSSGDLTPLANSVGSLAMGLINAGGNALELTAKLLGLKSVEEVIQALTAAIEGLANVINKIAAAIDWLSSKIDILNEKARQVRSIQSESLGIQITSQVYVPGQGYVTQYGKALTNPSTNDDLFGIPTSSRTLSNITNNKFNPDYFFNDVLVTKDGKTIQFNENDNILAFQGGLQSKKSGGTTVEEFGKKLEEQTSALEENTDTMSKFDAIVNQVSSKFRNLAAYAMPGMGQVTSVSSGGYAFHSQGCNGGQSYATVDAGGNAFSFAINPGDNLQYMSTLDTMARYNMNLNAGMSQADALKAARDYSHIMDITGLGTDQTFALRDQYTGGQAGTSMWDYSHSGGTSLTGMMSDVNDALITKRGDIVKFHPDDDILASKTGFKSKGINITFNITESKNARDLAREIMSEINRVVRVG